MGRNRFVVVIAHPTAGRILRLRIPGWSVQLSIGLALICAVASVGLLRTSHDNAAQNQRLIAANEALQEQYENVLQTVEDQDEQLKSLTNMAFQVSIAYGIRRENEAIDAAYGDEVLPAYYASASQFARLQQAVHRPVFGGNEIRANVEPSIWPVKGRITSTYGRRMDPFNGEGQFHPGMDISAPYRSAVKATADGRVVDVGWDGGLGNTVKIQHGNSGFVTVYGHLNEYMVRSGQRVQRGDVIGLVGATGRTTGNHVHYEVHRNGLSVNPYTYLRSKRGSYGISRAD